MQFYKNIAIIGTSHIAEQSIKEINKEFSKSNPDIIAVELDRSRLEALLKKEKPSYSPRLIFEIGVTGYFFALIGGLLQKKLGDLVGVVPGSDMLSACLLARENKKQLALIDQDVRITLRRISKEFTFREKMRMLFDIVRSPFSKKLKFDLKSVPEKQLIRQLISLLKKRYPGLYKSLIDERNHAMATRLANIALSYPDKRILAVMGAGHEEDVARLIEQKMKLQEKLI